MSERPAAAPAQNPAAGLGRLTSYAHGGGCACKIPPGELEEVVAGLVPWTSRDLLVGLDGAIYVLEDGDDGSQGRLIKLTPRK